MKLIQTNLKNRRTENYIGTLPNNAKSRELVKGLRVLYRPYGRLCLKGRNPNRQQFLGIQGRTKYQLNTLRLGMSTYFDVYLYRHDGKLGHKGIPNFYTLPDGIVKAWTIMKRA